MTNQTASLQYLHAGQFLKIYGYKMFHVKHCKSSIYLNKKHAHNMHVFYYILPIYNYNYILLKSLYLSNISNVYKYLNTINSATIRKLMQFGIKLICFSIYRDHSVDKIILYLLYKILFITFVSR